MSELRKILIVGCGIAGPVLGAFLRRLGLAVVICEARRPESSSHGAFLGVAPNGMNVLHVLGVTRPVEAAGVPCRSFEFLNASGTRIGVIDRTADKERFGAELLMIRRSDLHAVLAQAARERGVTVEEGRELVGLEFRGAGVCARFADGHAEAADAVIGCDGIRSRTRELVLPQSPPPAYSGLVDMAGFSRCPQVPLETGVNVMVFGRRAFFGAFRTPDGEVWWFHNSGEKSPQALVRDPEVMRRRIHELHAADPPWIHDVVDGTPEVLGPYPLHDILSLSRWHRGRVCLLGDAAHATTPSAGQGASMALEDAITLAKCIRDHDDVEHAFRTFEDLRRSRVEAVVKQSRRNGSGKAVSGPLGEWFRDRALPLFLRLGARAQSRVCEHRIAWD